MYSVGSYARIYVVEDLGHAVTMVEKAFSLEVANLLLPKSRTLSEQLSAKTICSIKVCPLTPSNVKADANAIDVVTGTVPIFGSVECII